MSIDWFTLAAQIFNLIILLFLLRKFLYLPVLKAVETRQKLIADELKKAEQSQQKAQKAEEACRQKAHEIETEKQQILAAAYREAEKLSADLQEQAENQYHKAQAEWKSRLKNEQAGFDSSVQKLVTEQFNRLAEKALRQMADTDLNGRIIDMFEQKIGSLPKAEKQKMIANFAAQKSLQIETAQNLSDRQKEQITSLLRTVGKVPDSARMQFKVNPELLGGIVVQGGEYMIEWSLNDYLQEFKQTMGKEVSKLISRGAA